MMRVVGVMGGLGMMGRLDHICGNCVRVDGQKILFSRIKIQAQRNARRVGSQNIRPDRRSDG